MNAESNIFAELTPPGRGGISTLALRSPRAADILSEIFRPGPAHVGRLLDNRHNNMPFSN